MLGGHGILGEQVVAMAMIVLALGIALVVQTARPDTPEYSGAVVWALVGVIVANTGPVNWPVLGLAAAGAAVLALYALSGRPARPT